MKSIHAVVTGHSRGLGLALARQLLAMGAQVLGLSRGGQPDLGDLFPARFRELPVDLADPAAVSALVGSEVWQDFLADASTLLLINNAGTLGPVDMLGQQAAAQIASALALNVSAPLCLSDAVMRSGASEVRIAHVSSGAARSAYAGWSVYGASKAALDHHARCVQQEQSPRLRIASIAPGVVDTDMQARVRASTPDQFPSVARFHALKADGLLASPKQVAEQLLRYCLSARFGQQPVVDLRDLN